MAERRSLWGSISMSEKVNKLSLSAALLYTWTIPHEDDFGYIEGDPKHIKAVVVPYRAEKTYSSQGAIRRLIQEIANVHRIIGNTKPLWTIYNVNGRDYIKDEYFEERQSFKAIHRKPSKIKAIVNNIPSAPSLHSSSTQEVQYGAKEVPKLSEVKRREVEVPPIVDNSVEISAQGLQLKDDGDELSPSILQNQDERTDEEFNKSLQETYPLIFKETIAEINRFLLSNPNTFKNEQFKRTWMINVFLRTQKRRAKEPGVKKQ